MAAPRGFLSYCRTICRKFSAALKLLARLWCSLIRLELAWCRRALGLAHRCDLDLAQTLELLKASAAYSEVMDTQGEVMLSHDFNRPVARLSIKKYGRVEGSSLRNVRH